jgi:hypothetical protein
MSVAQRFRDFQVSLRKRGYGCAYVCADFLAVTISRAFAPNAVSTRAISSGGGDLAPACSSRSSGAF